jgi:hypothetical protein
MSDAGDEETWDDWTAEGGDAPAQCLACAHTAPLAEALAHMVAEHAFDLPAYIASHGR